MAGSDLSDALLEGGLIVSGPLDGVLKGKNYEWVMYCHKALFEGPEQLLLEKYQDISRTECAAQPDESQGKLNSLVHHPGLDSHSKALREEGLKKHI